MTLKQAISILKQHNEWRRSGDIEMCNPTEIGEAIDIAIEVMEQHTIDCDFFAVAPIKKQLKIKAKITSKGNKKI